MSSQQPEEKKKSPRDLVIERGQWCPIPNLIFDEVQRWVPCELLCLIAYLYRHTVGFQRWYFEKSLSEIRNGTRIRPENLSRWLRVLDRAGWFKYTPARNGGGASKIRFVRLPDAKEAQNFALSLDEALEKERDWARTNIRVVTPKKQYADGRSHSYEKQPRAPADNFANVFENEFKKRAKEPATAG
jgi:hypothetical protein